jgi:CIC family chloride channel protein
MDPQKGRRTGNWLLPLLKLRIWLAEVAKPNETQATLVWAGLIGFLAGGSSVCFRKLTEGVEWLLTRHTGEYVDTFAHLPLWQRLVTPAIGGLLAGLTLLFGARLNRRKSSTDYMEAIVLGTGVISSRASFVKCASALFTIASGGSIGREGPMVQLAAVLASLVGRWGKMTTARLRLLVACGAAGGIASAYNAPIGGALFVAEIILGTLAMESFGPLVFSSVIATLTYRQFLGTGPLYQIMSPAVKLNSNWEILPHMLLGVVAGLCGPWFLRFLRGSERLFSKTSLPPYARLALGGLIVGALALSRPEVCGNGYSVVNSLLLGGWVWQTVLLILVLKMAATAASFGSGAVGGVFTPTIFTGASIGYLFGVAIIAVWPGRPPVLSVFTLVGMGALLSATTHAPIMAIILIFEVTLDYGIILPLMLACVIAHYTSSAIEPASIYSESLKRKGAAYVRQQLANLRVADLMKKAPVAVAEASPFADIAESFLTNRFNYLYVVGDNHKFKGAISLHDIKSYLSDPELASIVIARDILRDKFPTVAPEESLSDALNVFSRHDGERLPVMSNFEDRKLVGSISKTDVILALAEQSRPLSSTQQAAVSGEPTGPDGDGGSAA